MPECTARYNSKCSYCDETIRKGQDRIVWIPSIKNSAVHVRCFDELKSSNIPLELFLANRKGRGQQSQSKDEFDFDSGGGSSEGNQSEGQSNSDPITQEKLSEFLRDAQKTIDKNAQRAMSRLKMSNEQIEQKIKQHAEGSMEEAVKKYAQKVLEVKQTNGESVKIDGAHKNLEELIELISIKPREHAYAWGPPGSGKSTGAMHAAKALSMDYAYISLNPQTPESRLLGFIDATGVYRPTPFRKIYENGGVFCIDELDNASPSLLTTLNGCLENGTAAFPDSMVQAHDDFVVVATGNTSGRGGDQFFPERRPFDAAFAERFSFIYWDYDETLERQIALAFNPNAEKWIDWVQEVRKYCKQHIIRLTVSPRASIKGAKQTRLKEQNPLYLADRVLFKGLGQDDKNRILQAVGNPPEVKVYGE